ncbi:MAG: F0F1 ATP synthase subunit A [Atopobiaceae bacterium]|nr:F0F1 ATP synthase subunit A [Atopobiaceae bacterium]MCH4180393.1 F0F1 ATP synthase subunit A [Atopobiaceae bacterium]MCH4214515.1 F0F1 ATP synthase subunit A [Atopobiaceae bacterium]MCH4229234.1 F0F1 ATP synthase subunit A [Atopobiaceae bacterium]MCH4276289.1 F0F1 ATP synthase subunit A [Atopobiaceae bacterium]
MEQFEKLPSLVDELVTSFVPAAAVGTTTFGITQYSFWMYVAVIILAVLMVVFVRKQKATLVPQGRFVNAMEMCVDFVKNDMLKATVGATWRKHFPFIATVFFFVLINNLLGVIPGMRPGTGAIGTTAAIACCSFVYFIAVGIKKWGGWTYIKSLAPKGVAFPMNILVWVIEVFSTFLRLITLAVRLFCNMLAGHIVMGTFCILISIFVEPLLQSFSVTALTGAATSIIWLLILLIIYAVEILVAAIQAYVFALLSAVYVQLAEAGE